MRGRRAPLLMLPSWLSSRGARVLPAATLILVAIATARMQDLMAIGVAHAAAVTWISCAGNQQTAIGCPVPRSVGAAGALPMPSRAAVRDDGGQRQRQSVPIAEPRGQGRDRQRHRTRAPTLRGPA